MDWLTQTTREQWLTTAVQYLREIFRDAGHELPTVKVSCSWPGGGSARTRIGECWPTTMSAAGVNEIFISPRIADPLTALDILTHELVHAVDDCAHGHRKEFVRIGNSVGLNQGKPTNRRAGPELVRKLMAIVDCLGKYPHDTLDLSSRKKQTCRMLKLSCKDCDAVWRMSNEWAQQATQCPCCGSENILVEEKN